eukprot:TRINITY_DN20736_c0_g1_i1.p1 TRINITY_DN20736_c0_g1~~TRINITY_DN20736_c0_g1_i1.p1  ORF type:complete len:248 (+),score=29.61 TRINITY_DN20736_c0_g1_i1:169-912(+)
MHRNCSKLKFETMRRSPVVLILDPELQPLPWESLPMFITCKQQMSRMPSLQYLVTLYNQHSNSSSSVLKSGVAKDSVFYVINPDKSLPKTQERLEGAMSEYGEGLAGQAPQRDQLIKVLGNKDAFIFSGHGSGSKYLSSDEIEKLQVRVVPLLLGCSSGELSRYGRNIDPLGVAHSYLLASSPAFVGFLWPVTDLDLDNWTIEFLRYWLTGQEGNIMQAVADKRDSFKHFVNAAGLVVYGLPVSSKP